MIAFVIIISVLLYFFSERFTRSWLPIDNGFGESVSLSPDDETIVFPFYQSGDGALYKANVDGSNVTQLTYPRQAESHVHPRFSSKGDKILFLSQEKHPGTLRQILYVMNKDGTNLVKLSDEEELVTDAIFSEDDQHIYFFIAREYEEGSKVEAGPTNVDLYSVSVTGENKQKITEDASLKKRSLSITEDGRYLGYVEMDNVEEVTQSFFILYDLKEKQKQSITPDFNFVTNQIYSAKISPDGKVVAFSAATENPRKKSQFIYEMYTMDTNGNEVKRITSFRTFITEPVFFRKKERILFIQDQSWKKGKPNYKLWAVDADGEKIQSITLQMPQFSGTIL
jgi:TolB protein